MKNVMLKIEGMQKSMDGEENVIELTTEGKLYEKENAMYLVYDETELSGMDGSTTTVKLSRDKISMKRFGVSNSEMIFEKGKRYVANYNTPYGNFDMEVLTMDMEFNINDASKGDVFIEYHLSLKGLMETQNTLSIRIM